jgi:hypothetical protein
MTRTKKRFLTKKNIQATGGILKIFVVIFYYPIMLVIKGFVWVCSLIWQYLKPLWIKLKDLVFSDYGNNNEQKTDAL